jgi:acyl transferase domain-containing protein
MNGVNVVNGNNGTHSTNGVNGIKAVSRRELLLFSANSAASLSRQMDSFQKYIAEHPGHVKDAAYTLALRREQLPHRAFAIFHDGKVLETSAQVKAQVCSLTITMVFSGQGAQWPRMGRELLLTSPLFRRDIVCMDEILQGLRIPPKWSLIGRSSHIIS